MNDATGYLNHSLNSSKSKAAFSFPRALRMNENYKSINSSMYELPSSKSNRACSLGYGNKTNLARDSIAPSPDRYKILSAFQTKNSQAIAFGISRQNAKFGSFLQKVDLCRKLPGPNAYKLNNSTLSKRGGRIAIRLPTDIDELSKKKTPGPATYSPGHLNINDNGHYIISKFKNNMSPSYHNPQNQTRSQLKKLKQVGPGSYQAGIEMGKSILSQFRSSVAGIFPKSQRQGVVQKEKLKLPGFNYRSFSQFGEKRMK